MVNAYTRDSVWRNRHSFFTGHPAIIQFLQGKWAREKSYLLRKELFAFRDNKIAVQFWYEYQDELEGMKWKRCYGIEHWTYDEEGKMETRMMSGNDIVLEKGEKRWFEGLTAEEVDRVEIPTGHM